MNGKKSLLNVTAQIPAPLDPGFVPAVLANRNYRDAVKRSTTKARLAIAAERENGCVYRGDIEILPPGTGHDADTRRFVERHIKFILWARGAWKLYLSGPDPICREIAGLYSAKGARRFDAEIMAKAYDQPFEVQIVGMDKVPATKESDLAIGGHTDGCRVGFDLGASDYKLAAVIDGNPVFSTEIPWQPSTQKDPAYHYSHILQGIRQAATHMPRVDAVGGSSAGIIVNNQVKAASLFRAVPDDAFAKSVKPMFLNIQKELGVPLIVINDGDVTALAGAMSLKHNAILGVAMGSSEAAGYLNSKGRILGYLSELAFAPVDFGENAAGDSWSQDVGVGALYFSQQAVNKLALTAGFPFPAEMLLPERLKLVQDKAEKGDKNAQDVFVTIGVYLGYTVPHYADYYDFENMLVLGRVTSGLGGELLIAKAQDVLKKEFPDIAERIKLRVPDEKSRRVGQAVAAASLPEIGRNKARA
jgi:predicted NBD/HSP70 family sugar kinase